MQAENKNYIVAIDLGSGSVTAAAGSKDPDGRLNIIDMVSKPMQGMSCGEVINIEQVTGAVRAAVGSVGRGNPAADQHLILCKALQP